MCSHDSGVTFSQLIGVIINLIHTGVSGPRLLDNYYWSDSNVFKNCKVVCMEMWGLQRKGSLRPQRKLKVGLEFPHFQYPNKAIKGDTIFLFCT